MSLTRDLFLLITKASYDLKQKLVNHGPKAKSSLLTIFPKKEKTQPLYWNTSTPFASLSSRTAFVLQ